MPREPSAVWQAAQTVIEIVSPLARSGLAGPLVSSAITEEANRVARATTHKDFISTNPSQELFGWSKPVDFTMHHDPSQAPAQTLIPANPRPSEAGRGLGGRQGGPGLAPHGQVPDLRRQDLAAAA